MKPMQRLKASRDARAKSKYSAADSHVDNDKYMSDFEKAWQEMHGEPDSEPSTSTNDAIQAAPAARSEAQQRAEGPRYIADGLATVADGFLTGPIDEMGVLSIWNRVLARMHCHACEG